MRNEKRSEAQNYIREHATEYFKPDRVGKGYICPICGSGSGEKGTGITENPKSRGHFTCWAGCFENADIFEIIGKKYGLEDFNEIFERACEEFGIRLDEEDFSYASKAQNKKQESQSNASGIEDYTSFYNMAAKNLSNTDYHRGISLETLKRFNVGYVAQWRHPKAPDKVPYTPRLIIPVWKGGYLARDTRPNLTDEQKKYVKMRVGTMRLFNESALRQNESPVFVVEGEIDALSIIDVGGEAIALCSIANIKKLIEAVKLNPPKVPLIIMLDGDERGREATQKLTQGLSEINFSFYRQISIPEPYKDANEFLMNDREKFVEWVKVEANNDDIESLKEEAEQAEQEELEAFEREAVSYYLNDFLQEVKKNREGRAISTGFENLDEIFNGGLYPGLYFVGANSSLGKTTLILQIADNIAQGEENGVLIFSLEMARNELIAKSLSRLSFIKSIECYDDKKFAKTTRGILRGNYNENEQKILMEAIKEYHSWGENIRITEGVGDVGVSHIKEKTEEYIKYKGKPPVIIIDYIQILAPHNEKYTDKQNTDKNVLELKRLSRDYGIPVIGISSFNRESYRMPVSMASFKESGAIEYSSDVLIGLQYNGWDIANKDGKPEKDSDRIARLNLIQYEMNCLAKKGSAQNIQAKILKNRNGVRGSVYFEFFPMFNCFRPYRNTED